MLAKGSPTSQNFFKITTREMLLKIFSILTCITTQSRCMLGKAWMPKGCPHSLQRSKLCCRKNVITIGLLSLLKFIDLSTTFQLDLFCYLLVWKSIILKKHAQSLSPVFHPFLFIRLCMVKSKDPDKKNLLVLKWNWTSAKLGLLL